MARKGFWDVVIFFCDDWVSRPPLPPGLWHLSQKSGFIFWSLPLLFTKNGILAIRGLISISHYPVKSQLMSFAQTLISSMPFAHSPSFKPLTHTLPPHQTGSVVQCRQIGIKDCVEKNLFTPVRIALSSAHVSSIETVIHRLSIASSSHLILSELGWCFLPLHTGE